MPKTRSLTTISIDHFSWTRGESGRHIGVADASDLPANLASRIYDDAADIGFAVAGKSGRRVVFSLRREERNDENELTAEVFESDEQPNVTIYIFND